MGKVFDKHGRMQREDPYHDSGSELCTTCGRRVQDLDTHNQLFHPTFRNDSTRLLVRKPAKPYDPEQSSLVQYPDDRDPQATDSADADAEKGS